MNTLIEQINSTGRAFVEFAWPMLWQSSLLIVILLAADFMLRNKVRAVFRYWLWMLIIIKLVLPTSLYSPVSIGQVIDKPLIAINTITINQPVESDIANIALDNSAALPEIFSKEAFNNQTTVTAANPNLPAIPLSWQGAALIVWLAVVFAMILLLLQRAMFVCGLVRQAKESNDLMKDILSYCCKTMGVEQTIGLKVSPNATSPAVCGLWRPVILLPHGIGSNLGSSGLRVVLMHELAHIKRGDLWINLAQTLLQIFYFYNPLLWLANWVIRRIREQAVDEAVQVALGEKASQYPETLLNVARLAFERPALSLRLIGVVESKNALTGRIKRMLTLPIPKTAKLGIIGSALVILLAVILLPMAGAKDTEPGFVIKGSVTDAVTGKPIAGAKVGDDKYADGKYGAVTDSNGNYSYKTWYEEHNIKAEADGYERQQKLLATKFLGSEKEEIIDFALEPGDKKAIRAEAMQSIDFKITSSGFLEGDSIEITDLSGSAGVIRPGETYIVSGRYTLKSHDEALLHVYATNGETQSSQGPSIKRGEGQFTRTFTLLKGGDLHLSFYPAKSGNGFGGVYFAPGVKTDVRVEAGKTETKPDENLNDYSSVTVQEGIGFDGFIVGDPNCTGEFIKSKLGKPDEEKKYDQQGTQLVYYKQYGLDFWLDYQDNRMYEIRINPGFKGKLKSGISMSSTKQDVFRVYGNPVREDAVENQAKSFGNRILFMIKPDFSKIYYYDKGMLFWFKGDKINQIVILAEHNENVKTGLKVYPVNKSVNEFDQKEDFSTPESAYASINRISANEDADGWVRVSIKELAEKLSKENNQGKMNVEPEWAKVLLNANILEVRICDGNNAIAMAQLPQEFSSQPIRKPIDVRYLKLEENKWLNTGNDRVWTIEEARAQFDSQCNKVQEKNSKDKQAKNPAEPVIATVEFAKAQKANTNESDGGFKAMLPNGVTVELVGICDYPTDGKKWWRPDGSELKETFKLNETDTISAMGKPYVILLKIVGPNEKYFSLDIESSHGQGGPMLLVTVSKGLYIKNLLAIKAFIDEQCAETNIKVNVAAGLWTTDTGMSYNGNGILSSSNDEYGVVFSTPQQTDKGVAIVVSDNSVNRNSRVVAIDDNNGVHTGLNNMGGIVETGGTERKSQIHQTTAVFGDITLDKIKEFQFQTRPLEWAEFKNVSLRPEVKTDVKVIVEKSGAKAEGQPIIAAAEYGEKPTSESNTPKVGNSDDIELSNDDGKKAGMLSNAGSGHCVKFITPKEGKFLKAVKIYGSRYGEFEPPEEDFHVWLCDPNFEVIKEFAFPYSEFKMRGLAKWVTLDIEQPTELPAEFIICVGFAPEQTKGIYMHYDANASSNSFIGLPGNKLEPFNKGDWMIRAVVGKTAETKLKAKKPAPTPKNLPVVTGTNPAVFANDVSPELGKLTVTFNQRMADKSWAWVQWDAPFPDASGSPYYDKEMRTCAQPVKLKPGKAYLVGFNIKPYIGFVNTSGQAARPYVLVFATKDKDGKPTPIPQELLDKAKSVNQQSRAE